ncbi:hypothetical protein MesoLjLc_54460 [Mesorhizobium sp. L-8-10]|uniref:DUF1993 domain-containing protein n=1 Tax=unclassified Mesorhizobium TaxID=325217 RepID=UPI001925C379|nr:MULTISPECIES: DUF1993 family protein [unclassified Mesorhizobium]BCH25516.1 hypothetical protein MesoLjLb_53010 [Mesorhizobium sp. L-8-3]BCH33516.1 hypothetical protein MesoLjLc_54460 [Mesorhizobium sp. L-8-10]
MTISMYQASVPVFITTLKGLSHVLSKGEAHATEKGIDPQTLVEARLAPDMFALARQVQIATDHAKGAPSRLAGREIPKFEDTENSFPELQGRIAKTVELLKGFAPQDIDGSEERSIALPMRSGELSFTGMQYLLHFAMPNFYFHVTTAYDILRHNGVAIGKADFFGRG